MTGKTGRPDRVLAGKGAKHVYQLETGTENQITVLCCFNAAGFYMKPYIIMPGVYQNANAIYGRNACEKCGVVCLRRMPFLGTNSV